MNHRPKFSLLLIPCTITSHSVLLKFHNYLEALHMVPGDWSHCGSQTGTKGEIRINSEQEWLNYSLIQSPLSAFWSPQVIMETWSRLSGACYNITSLNLSRNNNCCLDVASEQNTLIKQMRTSMRRWAKFGKSNDKNTIWTASKTFGEDTTWYTDEACHSCTTLAWMTSNLRRVPPLRRPWQDCGSARNEESSYCGGGVLLGGSAPTTLTATHLFRDYLGPRSGPRHRRSLNVAFLWSLYSRSLPANIATLLMTGGVEIINPSPQINSQYEVSIKPSELCSVQRVS